MESLLRVVRRRANAAASCQRYIGQGSRQYANPSRRQHGLGNQTADVAGSAHERCRLFEFSFSAGRGLQEKTADRIRPLYYSPCQLADRQLLSSQKRHRLPLTSRPVESGHKATIAKRLFSGLHFVGNETRQREAALCSCQLFKTILNNIRGVYVAASGASATSSTPPRQVGKLEAATTDEEAKLCNSRVALLYCRL